MSSETTYTEFSILKGSERAFIKSLGRQVDQETFAMTKTPQERISRDVAQTRARYEVTLRNLQQFVRTYYKRLAQKPGSGSRSESQIGEKLQELREKRLNLNDALKRNQDYQRAVVDGAVEGSWSRQAELKQLILLTEHFETHPLLLRPQTRDWLTEKLTQRRSFLDRAETKQGTLRPAGEIRDGANLMLLSLRLLESELNQSYLETYNLERTVQMTLSNDGRLSGVSLALALERSGKLLTRLRARSKKILEVKIRRHIDARLSEMRLNLQQGLNQLRNQSAALNLAEAKTRQLVDVLAIDALVDLRSYLDELLVRDRGRAARHSLGRKSRAGSRDR